MRLWKTFAIAGVAMLLSSTTARAYFDDYDDSQSHPLRIAAYALNPIGYTLEWLVARPIHALVSQPELEPIFGHKPHRWGGEEGEMPVATGPVTAPPSAVAGGPTVNPADLEAARRAADEARAAADEAKRAAEEAARAAEKATRAFDKGLRK